MLTMRENKIDLNLDCDRDSVLFLKTGRLYFNFRAMLQAEFQKQHFLYLKSSAWCFIPLSNLYFEKKDNIKITLYMACPKST